MARVCDFRTQGFPFDERNPGGWARPCGTSYHDGCIVAGEPFKTRLGGVRGLSYPINMPFPHFTCECCQVRSALGRELRYRNGNDLALLLLERVRMIDISCAWKQSTLTTYGPAVRYIQRFEKRHGIAALTPTALVRPPVSPALGLQYSQLQYSVEQMAKIATQTSGAPKTFQTTRRLRSAASAWYNMDMQHSYPLQAVREVKSKRAVRVLDTVPTETLAMTLGSGGMARRMGTQSKPSWALKPVHIAYMDAKFDEMYQAATTAAGRHEVATAATVNLIGYLGWLRGGEIFGMKANEVSVTRPVDGPTMDLPPGVGAISCRLKPDTKSDPTITADVIMAFTTVTGLSLGLWLDRLSQHDPVIPGLLLSTPARPRWTSRYFRVKYAWPLLERMRVEENEPTLRCFSDKKGHRIRDKVWGMHSWRRAGRSACQRPVRPGEIRIPHQRIAKGSEVTEHGRWRSRHQGEAMEVHYDQWDAFQRVCITLFCM